MIIPSPHLVLIGTGIKFLSHLTTEAKTHIQQSSKLLYLLNDPVLAQWVETQNTHAESLAPFYFQHCHRKDAYQSISNYILDTLVTEKNVCVLFYGHPIIFVQSGIAAVQTANQQGYCTKILPAVSAEDCLFADLQINPGEQGWQSFDATDFLLYQRKFDVRSHLILWQIASIGNFKVSDYSSNLRAKQLLREYLLSYQYPADFKVILYEAAQYPGCEPTITFLSLHELTSIKIEKLATLYIPPLCESYCDTKILSQLNVHLAP